MKRGGCLLLLLFTGCVRPNDDLPDADPPGSTEPDLAPGMDSVGAAQDLAMPQADLPGAPADLSTPSDLQGAQIDLTTPADLAAQSDLSPPCAADTQNDPFNCGACGHVCVWGANSYPRCTAGVCGIGCDTGFADCDGLAATGCEASLTAASSCGACNIRCDTAHSLGATCGASGCSYSGCSAGFGDCQSGGTNTNGCETALNSPSACGACGVSCGLINATAASCSSARCGFTCKPGFSDCSGAGANTNGCECATPGCCAGGCQSSHTNGLGQRFYDCSPLGTYNQSQAMAACVAYTGNPAECALGICGTTDSAVAAVNLPDCPVWVYSGGAVGHVRSSSGCFCPNFLDPSWN